MKECAGNSSGQLWHTNDFLIEIARGDLVGTPVDSIDNLSSESPSVSSLTSGAATLALVSSQSEVYETESVQRSAAFDERKLVAFGARTRSTWALDVLTGRYTQHSHDWASLRAIILDSTKKRPTQESVLHRMSIEKLYRLVEVLHERQLDAETEHALLRVIAARIEAAESFPKASLEPLVERLLQADMGDAAQALLPKLTTKNWVRNAFTIELEHPRFGGSFDAMLGRLNESYRRVAIEPVTLDAPGDTPYRRLSASPQAPAERGPLVTVIMTCWNPGTEIFTAVRSIIDQTHQNWELLITDDASSPDAEPTLLRLSELDSRVRVIRNEVNAGTYVRRNEAIQAARGEFVTMQDSDDWAHPHRLEVQLRDLTDNPARLGNVVHAARVTEDFSFVSSRGARLFLAEPSLMFRRQAVVDAIGYYDSVRKSADTEFRKRLEIVAKRPVQALLPDVPLQLMLADPASLSGADFGTNIWNHPDRLRYWSATRAFHKQIEAGIRDPRLRFPQDARVFDAPPAWLEKPSDPLQVDLLHVLDGRELKARTDFHNTVVDELRVAVEGGLSIAIVQSDSVQGPRGMSFFPPALQALVDSGSITRVSQCDDVHAEVAVVRHAGAAQGHPADRWAVSAKRVVVIEDQADGDARGTTVAARDVSRTVAGWFGVEPTWLVARPTLSSPSVTAIALEPDRLRLTISANCPGNVRAVRLSNGSTTLTLGPRPVDDNALTAVTNGQLTHGDWVVVLEYDAGAGRTLIARCAVSSNATIWNTPDQLVLTKDDALRLLPTTADDGTLSSREFVEEYLSVSARRARVIDDRFELSLSDGDAAILAHVYALREVDGFIVRRRDFEAAASAGHRVWQRPLAKFTESRWRLFGTFHTPLGLVEYPINIDDNTALEGTSNWMPQLLTGGRVLIAHPQPAATRWSRLAGRVTDAINGKRFSGVAGAVRSGAVAPVRDSAARLQIDSRHAAVREMRQPTVSVVMPVYNVEPYLKDAILSVLNQDFSDLELIIVDDASTDNGREIILKHWEADSRVRVFAVDHNTIGGAGVPSNVGIRAARGTYVAFADSDDHVTNSGLAKLVQLAEAHSAEVVIGDFRTFSDRVKDGTDAYDHKTRKALPLNSPISGFTHPDLFRLSPVPWRKLYRRDFLRDHKIVYPEGDYFYEDNPLHWFVLSRARRVIVCDEVVSFHRQEREGQTMGAQTYKLGAFVNHANTILNFISDSDDDQRDVLFEAFFEYLDRSHWVVTRQTQPTAAALIRRGFGDVYARAVEAAPGAKVPPLVRSRLATYRSAYRDIDLTVVIPVYNSADLLKQTLDSVLKVKGIRINVLMVDDGSTDGSLAVMHEYELRHANVHVFAQGNRGAGRARNSVIPLCTGRYTFFLDADDVVDAGALAKAVAQADSKSADLLFVKYRIDFTDEDRSQGMFGGDKRIWEELPKVRGNAERQRLLSGLINYPWNRIIRTSLLHDANVFFGATVVHNDVMFHWHSIVSAQRISSADVVVCAHRKFATRAQVTNIHDARRMSVLEALRSTYERIAPLADFANVRDEWLKFATHLLGWAAELIPDELKETYAQESRKLERSFDAS